MSLRSRFSDFFRLGLDVLQTQLSSATNTLIVNLGDSGSGYTDSDQAEVWNACQGVMCMPAAPSSGASSCQALVVTGGNRDSVIAMRDVRSTSTVGTLSPGDSVLFATGAGRSRVYCRQSGDIVIQTETGNSSSGTPVTITVSQSGTITVGGSSSTVLLAGGANPLATGPWAVAMNEALTVFATSCGTSTTDPTLVSAANALLSTITNIAWPQPETTNTKAT